MSRVTLLGLHIPKCAGTSLLEMAENQIADYQIFQATSLIQNWNRSKPHFLEIKNHYLLRFIWGHWVHEEMLKYASRPFLFTGLRHPKERLLSEYNFQLRLRQAQGRSIADFSQWKNGRAGQICNFIVQRFPSLGIGDTLLERAKSILDKFQFVYFTENFEQSSKDILGLIGCSSPAKRSNVAAMNVPVPEIDDADVDVDLALYEWAKERFADKSVDAEFDYNPHLKRFINQPKEEKKLNEFLLVAEAVEIVDFNQGKQALIALENSVLIKKELIAFIKAEILRRID